MVASEGTPSKKFSVPKSVSTLSEMDIVCSFYFETSAMVRPGMAKATREAIIVNLLVERIIKFSFRENVDPRVIPMN
jgi:hypothetical protein